MRGATQLAAATAHEDVTSQPRCALASAPTASACASGCHASQAVDSTDAGFKKYASAMVVGHAIALCSSGGSPRNAPRRGGGDDVGFGGAAVSVFSRCANTSQRRRATATSRATVTQQSCYRHGRSYAVVVIDLIEVDEGVLRTHWRLNGRGDALPHRQH